MTKKARIYRPARTAMQSGRARTRQWVLEYEPAGQRFTEPLMGWTGSADMNSQIVLRFDTLDEAIAYVRHHDLPYQVYEPPAERRGIKSYADNFNPARREPWTH
ncbi:MAG: ETC complex I subunit [Parvularculales bacterium]